MITCPVDWGTHGCSLHPQHEGDHLCLLLIYKYPWIWMDAGSWCNFWNGKEIGFLHEVCSREEKT
jgi:hypothetical protein